MPLTWALGCGWLLASIGIGPTIEALRGLAMAKVARTDAVWVEVAVESLPQQAQEAYQYYKSQYTAMKGARETFENAMATQAKLPEGKRMVFGYNFGKLSVAVVADDRKPKAEAKRQSLADVLAGQGQ